MTTGAFRRIMTTAPWIDGQLDRRSRPDPDDREATRTLSAQIRRALEGIAMPDDLAAAITRSVIRPGGRAACAGSRPGRVVGAVPGLAAGLGHDVEAALVEMDDPQRGQPQPSRGAPAQR